MEKIALAVFGTSDGTDAYVSPKSFTLPEPPHRVIDTLFPFLADRDVFRYYRVRGAERDLVLLAIYTKIDDFGGPRGGAFAGAGVFVRNAFVDSQLLVAVLKDLLGGLIAAATQHGQFVCKVSQAMAEGRVKPPAQASALADSANPVIQANFSTGISAIRQLIEIDDLLITDAVSFFNCVQFNPEWFGNDVFFSRDPETHRACHEIATINTVTIRSLKERWVIDYRKREDDLINQLNAARSNLKASDESRARAIDEAVSDLKAKNANLHQEMQSLTTAREYPNNWATGGGTTSVYWPSTKQHGIDVWPASDGRKESLNDWPVSNAGSGHSGGSRQKDRPEPPSVMPPQRRTVLIYACIGLLLLVSIIACIIIFWVIIFGSTQAPTLSQPVATVPSAQQTQRSDISTVTDRAVFAAPKLTENYYFTPAVVLNVNRAGELAKYISSFCPDLKDHEKNVEERIIQSNAKAMSDSGAFLNNSNSEKILFSVPEWCVLKDVNGISKKLSLLNRVQKIIK